MSDRQIWWTVYGAVTAVAVWAFVVSYSHIYDLGIGHAQHGIAAKGLPLTVDLLIVAASLLLYADARAGVRRRGLARILPRLMLWSGIGATVGANVAYGLPSGWLSAIISAWPGAVFAGLAETVMVTARKDAPKPGGVHVFSQVASAVPESALDAARAALAASVAGGNPLKETQLATRYRIPRTQAAKLRRELLPAPSVNGSDPDAS